MVIIKEILLKKNKLYKVNINIILILLNYEYYLTINLPAFQVVDISCERLPETGERNVAG